MISQSRPDQTILQWRKSTHSAQGDNSCVEVADAGRGVIAVRDSKNPNGPALAFRRSAVRALARRIHSGELDL